MALLVNTSSRGPRGIPGDGGLPLIGYTWQLANGSLIADGARYDRYGPVSWSRALGTTFRSAKSNTTGGTEG